MDGVTRVFVSGAAGRLGRRILAHVDAAPDLELAGAVVREGSPQVGQMSSALAGAALSRDPQAQGDLDGLGPEAVLIEVTPKGPALDHARRAAATGARLVIASTGFNTKERAELKALAQQVPLLLAPNLSMGVAVLTDLVARAAKALPDYHLELVELHHSQKRDAPSGTAWALARAAKQARGEEADRDAVLARAGEIGPRGEQEIGLQSVRGGDIIGEHTLYLVGPTERVELTHRAATRDVFAAGAVTAARFMGAKDRSPGLYSMSDVLGL